MYELTATLQFAQTISNVLIFAQSVEATIYDLDAKFQSHVVPWVTERAIATFIAFIRAAYLTFIAGGATREWFDTWFTAYCLDGVPAVEILLIEEPILMIEASKTRIAGLLMPAKDIVTDVTTVPKRTRKAKTESKGKPAPKSRKPAGIAPRKAPTLARVGNYAASID